MSGPFNGYDYDHRHVCKWCGKQGYKTNTGYYNDNYCSEKCYEEKISSSSNSTNSSSGACFIATSVYGDYNHPIVLDLRQFRDNWLGKKEKKVKNSLVGTIKKVLYLHLGLINQKRENFLRYHLL